MEKRIFQNNSTGNLMDTRQELSRDDDGRPVTSISRGGEGATMVPCSRDDGSTDQAGEEARRYFGRVMLIREDSGVMFHPFHESRIFKGKERLEARHAGLEGGYYFGSSGMVGMDAKRNLVHPSLSKKMNYLGERESLSLSSSVHDERPRHPGEGSRSSYEIPASLQNVTPMRVNFCEGRQLRSSNNNVQPQFSSDGSSILPLGIDGGASADRDLFRRNATDKVKSDGPSIYHTGKERIWSSEWSREDPNRYLLVQSSRGRERLREYIHYLINSLRVSTSRAHPCGREKFIEFSEEVSRQRRLNYELEFNRNLCRAMEGLPNGLHTFHSSANVAPMGVLPPSVSSKQHPSKSLTVSNAATG